MSIDDAPPRRTSGQRNRTLQRRVAGGTVLVIAFLYAIWRSWELEGGVFWQLLVTTVVMILLAMTAGALVALLWRWLRRLGGD